MRSRSPWMYTLITCIAWCFRTIRACCASSLSINCDSVALSSTFVAIVAVSSAALAIEMHDIPMEMARAAVVNSSCVSPGTHGTRPTHTRGGGSGLAGNAPIFPEANGK